MQREELFPHPFLMLVPRVPQRLLETKQRNLRWDEEGAGAQTQMHEVIW